MSSPSIPDGVTARLRAAGCVFAEEEAELLVAAAGDGARLEAMVQQRVAGLPLEHVLGWAELCGVRVVVEPGVFVPRRRTALLVREAAALLPPGGVVLDLCCGSGAIGAVLLAGDPAVELHASDVDPVAVACARRNVEPHGHVYEGDLDAALPVTLRGRVDVLVANAPYVPSDAVALLPHEARDHEPRATLDGGPDGLDVQRRVVAVAGRWLAPGGHVLVETSAAQAPASAQVLRDHGLRPRTVHDDDLDATVVVGTAVSGPPPGGLVPVV